MQKVLSDKQAMANIAANVTKLRGLRSRTWLAKACGTYPINITRIENAENLPSSGLLARLAEALETTTDALLSLDATKHSIDLRKKFAEIA